MRTTLRVLVNVSLYLQATGGRCAETDVRVRAQQEDELLHHDIAASHWR